MKIEEIGENSILTNVLETNKQIRKEKKKISKSKQIYTNIIKRISDIIIGLIGVICLIPLTLVIYILRKIFKEDGPMFYEQLRIGKNGKHFRLYKPIY